jgi:iron complex transport system substrate-binding protein
MWMRRLATALAIALAACGDVPAGPVAPVRRVVSLAPSCTEIVYALGAGERLVGVCAQCDFPKAVEALPRVGGFLAPSAEAVIGARPDVVFTVPSPGNHDAVRAVEAAGVRVVVMEEHTLAELWAGIRAIAAALDLPAEGEALVARVQGELDAVHRRVAERPITRALMVVGHDPLVAVGPGTLQDELLRIAGGENVAASTKTLWPTLALEMVVATAPDVIVDAAMGGDRGDRTVFAALTTVPAVRDGRVLPVRGGAFYRAGPRVGEAAAELAAMLHPDRPNEAARR